MKHWAERLDGFLTMTGRELLTHAGKIRHEQALEKAQVEYEKYRQKKLAEPSEVEKHFLKAEKSIKEIPQKKNK